MTIEEMQDKVASAKAMLQALLIVLESEAKEIERLIAQIDEVMEKAE